MSRIDAVLPPLPIHSERVVSDAFWDGKPLFTGEDMQAYALLAISQSFEQGRQQGMKQERALWELAASSQEITAALHASCSSDHAAQGPSSAGASNTAGADAPSKGGA